jgi:hypothetical protein
MHKLAISSLLVLASLTVPGCTASQGRITAQGLEALCEGGMIVFGAPQDAPLCVAPELIEKYIEALNPPTTAAHVPLTPAQRYDAAKKVGAKPIAVSK